MSTRNPNSDINAISNMGSEDFPESLEKIIRFDGRKALIVPVNSKRQILIQDRRGYKNRTGVISAEELKRVKLQYRP